MYSSAYINGRIFDNVIAKWSGPFACNRSFFTKYLQSSYCKTKNSTFSSLFLFLLSFSFLTVILKLLGLKRPTFWRLLTQMTANFVRLVFKNSARYIYIERGLRASRPRLKRNHKWKPKSRGCNKSKTMLETKAGLWLISVVSQCCGNHCKPAMFNCFVVWVLFSVF